MLGGHADELHILRFVRTRDRQHVFRQVDPHDEAGADARRHKVGDKAGPCAHVQHELVLDRGRQVDQAPGHPRVLAAGPGVVDGGNNVVSRGPRVILQGSLEIQGDLKIAGNVEGDLKASGDVTIDSGATIQASIEGANVQVRGQVNGNVTAKRRLTLGGSGRLNGDVKVGRLTVEDGASLNGNVTMSPEKG